MNIVGFNFSKISAERKKAVVGSIRINNNVAIKEVREAKIGLGDRGALGVSFQFKTQYTPDFAELTMEGDLVLLGSQNETKAALEQWEKEKRLAPATAASVMNYILDRCSIQALLLSKDLNLPPPVRLPKVNVGTPSAPEAPVKTTKVSPKKK